MATYSDLPENSVVDLVGNKTAYSVTDWYLSNSSTPAPTPYTLTSNINFYAVPNVIEITDQTELDNIRTNLGGKYILLNDIDLNAATDGFDPTNGWEPIGDYSTPFTGIFSGNGNKITNLWVNRTATEYVGLFGYIEDAQIKNLTVEVEEDKEVKGGDSVGITAGRIDWSTITDSYSMGNVNGNSGVGGIVGSVLHSSIVQNNAAINPSVTGTSDVNRIAGYIQSGTVTNNFTLDDMGGSFSGGNAGTSKPDEDLKTPSIYSDDVNGDGNGGLGWKFGNDANNPWKINAGKNNGYPYLYWE